MYYNNIIIMGFLKYIFFVMLFFKVLFVFAELLYIPPLEEGSLSTTTDGIQTRAFSLTANFSNDDTESHANFTTLYYESKNTKNNRKVLGPILKMDRGDVVQANIKSTLPVETSVHWHGVKDMPTYADGVFYPIDIRGSTNITFTVDQPGSTTWFHPHLHGTTAEQVYRGLIGVALIEDKNNPAEMRLPRTYGKDDFVLILSDKVVDEVQNIDYNPSTMDYMMAGYRGNYILTNWQFSPELNVPKGIIRVRLLNASTAQEIRVGIDKNMPMYLLASDTGILDTPEKVDTVFIPAGDRVELLVDTRRAPKGGFSFMSIRRNSGGRQIAKRFSKRNDNQKILTVYVKDTKSVVQNIPKKLSIDILTIPSTFAKERTFIFSGGNMRVDAPFTINGKTFSESRVDTISKANTIEKWTLINKDRGMRSFDHSFHVHASSFIVISVNGKSPPVDYQGWQDTIYLPRGSVVEIAFPVTKTKGLYVYHCHILEHEDAGMMGLLKVE